MTTDCSAEQLEFQGLGGRRVEAAFDAGRTSSDGGVLLLREYTERTGLLRQLAACFTDHRSRPWIEHELEELVAQRVLGVACGYEDLNDHDRLRDDALLATACGRADVRGEQRKQASDRGHPLAGKSTLNRLERTPADADASSRYHKVVYDTQALDELMVQWFVDSHREPPSSIVLDMDATDDPVHGRQEGRYFRGNYGCWCYLPLYIFCGTHLLCARLRSASAHPSTGVVEELSRIVAHIRSYWPQVQILVRGDADFSTDELMSWCEAHEVDYLLGLAPNERLRAQVGRALAQAEHDAKRRGQPARRYRSFSYQTLKTWTRPRRVIAKAEHLFPERPNPRFVVTTLPGTPRVLYLHYSERGDMENRIKEQQLGMFADRTSTETLRANQLRLYFASFAYILMEGVRRDALWGTELAHAQCGTIRQRLLKIAAVIRCSVRRIRISLSSVFPLPQLFRQALLRIRAAHPP